MVSLSLGVAKHQMIRFFAQQQPLIAERDLEMKTKQSQQLETNRDGKRRRRRWIFGFGLNFFVVCVYRETAERMGQQ